MWTIAGNETRQEIAEMFVKSSISVEQCVESVRAMDNVNLAIALQFAESYMEQEDEAPHPAILLGYAEYDLVLLKASRISGFCHCEIERRRISKGIKPGKPGGGPQRM